MRKVLYIREHPRDGRVQAVWTVHWEEIMRCVARGERGEKSNRDVKASLNTFPKHVVEVLVDLVEEELQKHGYALSLRVVLRSLLT